MGNQTRYRNPQNWFRVKLISRYATLRNRKHSRFFICKIHSYLVFCYYCTVHILVKISDKCLFSFTYFEILVICFLSTCASLYWLTKPLQCKWTMHMIRWYHADSWTIHGMAYYICSIRTFKAVSDDLDENNKKSSLPAEFDGGTLLFPRKCPIGAKEIVEHEVLFYNP